jgi:hypothetical protein
MRAWRRFVAATVLDDRRISGFDDPFQSLAVASWTRKSVAQPFLFAPPFSQKGASVPPIILVERSEPFASQVSQNLAMPFIHGFKSRAHS